MTHSLHKYDVVIIGQGLAGTTLAWALRWTGIRVAIIDRDEPVTSSKVAAGLITPVTGMRLVKTENFEKYFDACEPFYRRVENELRTELFQHVSMLRLLNDSAERDLFLDKRLDEYPELIAPAEDAINPAFLNCEWGAICMQQAAQLAVARYLACTRNLFQSEGSYRTAQIYPLKDFLFEYNQVHIPRLDLSAQKMIFCEGYRACENPWFQNLPYDSAKGEILTVRIPKLQEQSVIHRGIWMAPEDDYKYRIGATYDREHWNQIPTAAGRAELLGKLRMFLDSEVDVLKHHAAVRPIIAGRQVVIGFHPRQQNIGFFNGLGSKGALLAPWYAIEFANAIKNNTQLHTHCDVAQYF